MKDGVTEAEGERGGEREEESERASEEMREDDDEEDEEPRERSDTEVEAGVIKDRERSLNSSRPQAHDPHPPLSLSAGSGRGGNSSAATPRLSVSVWGLANQRAIISELEPWLKGRASLAPYSSA